jgi:hypothetical protein
MSQMITQTAFEKLPKNVQAFRWALFIESDGYRKNISKKRIKEIEEEVICEGGGYATPYSYL